MDPAGRLGRLSPLQLAVLTVMSACERAITVDELRMRLREAGFGCLPIEPVNRVVAALHRRGGIERVKCAGQKRASWAVVGSPALSVVLDVADAPSLSMVDSVCGHDAAAADAVARRLRAGSPGSVVEAGAA